MCRCLGGCSHAMSNNEERAWESWEQDMTLQLAVVRAACDAIEATVRLTRNPGRDIADALERVDEASEAIFSLRHGPEQPE
jgi:hypothetical protein